MLDGTALRPPPASDALSEVLGSVRMAGAVFYRVAARAPWVAEQLSRETVLPMIMPGADHMISYHIVTEGRCFANLVGGEAVELKAGQVIAFTRGDRHVMSSDPHYRLEQASRCANDAAPEQLPFAAAFGHSGPVTARLVCGFLACHSRPFNPLLDSLPPIIVADASDGISSLAELIYFAVDEAARNRPGGHSVLARLTELMFIEVVRRHIEHRSHEPASWLSGLRDPFVGRALAMMHQAPDRSLTLDSLAREVGLSRSEFAERFTGFTGIPPMQYFARWRMQVAGGLLRDGIHIAEVATQVGYGSEAAFSRAFKKIVGMSPSMWRYRVELLEAA